MKFQPIHRSRIIAALTEAGPMTSPELTEYLSAWLPNPQPCPHQRAFLGAPMSEITNLLPCPFCGQSDIAIKNEHPLDLSGGYFIECPDCGASTCMRYACGDDPRPLLIESWNRRAPGQCLHWTADPAVCDFVQIDDSSTLAPTASAAQTGMAWYNGCSETERARWHAVAGSAVPADAYRAFCGQTAKAGAPAAPVLYVSPEQLGNHRNPEGPESAEAGRYLPARKTPAGKFTQPLYAGAALAGADPITEQQAYDMGAKGAPATEAERLLFEAWMRGHCWMVCGTWNGTTYRGSAEHGDYIDPRAINTRQLWAAWRDRAALAAAPTTQAEPQTVELPYFSGLSELIVRDICEAERADPDMGDTICIDVSDLQAIIKRYTQAEPVAHHQANFQLWCTIVGGDFARCNCGPYVTEAMTLAGMAWHSATQSLAAPQAPAAPAVERDAARFRWLTDDHEAASVRVIRQVLCERLPVMSYSAACTDIDDAIAAQAAAKEGGAA